MKKVLSILFIFVLLSSSSSFVHASDVTKEIIENDGKEVYIFSTDDKEKVSKVGKQNKFAKLDAEMDIIQQKEVENMKKEVASVEVANPATRALIFHNHTNSDSDYGYDGNAKSKTYVYCDWYYSHAGFRCNLKAIGNQRVYWNGSGDWDQVVFNQTKTISGASLTISWPPSMSASGSTATWQSRPLPSADYAYASHEETNAYSYIALFSYTATDTADVYIGTSIYRPTSTVFLD